MNFYNDSQQLRLLNDIYKTMPIHVAIRVFIMGMHSNTQAIFNRIQRPNLLMPSTICSATVLPGDNCVLSGNKQGPAPVASSFSLR
eukprot:m.122777 g.122777  ORF g.122777 m.122777 type:complete len:86 (+) comp14430_c1_seq4:130-387(+)